MRDRTVTEESVLSEKLTVIRRDDDPRVRRDAVEEALDHAVEVAKGDDLTFAELRQELVVESRMPVRPCGRGETL